MCLPAASDTWRQNPWLKLQQVPGICLSGCHTSKLVTRPTGLLALTLQVACICMDSDPNTYMLSQVIACRAQWWLGWLSVEQFIHACAPLIAISANCHALHLSAGFDSVVAKGVRAPDPSRDKVLKLEGRRVKVPVGPPVPAQQFAHSSFLQVSWQCCESCRPRSGGKAGRLWAPRRRCSSICRKRADLHV